MVQITHAIGERVEAEARRERIYVEWQTRRLRETLVMIAPPEFDLEVREELFDVIAHSSSMLPEDDEDDEVDDEVEGVDYRMVRGKRFPIRMNNEAQVAGIAGPMVMRR